MAVKVRKVGNSFTVSIPANLVETLHLYDGQELDVKPDKQTIVYSIINTMPETINWSLYETEKLDEYNDMTPDEYIRAMRDDER